MRRAVTFHHVPDHDICHLAVEELPAGNSLDSECRILQGRGTFRSSLLALMRCEGARGMLVGGDHAMSPEAAIRLGLARRLAANCPEHLGSEIAVTGSVARGMADRFSDIELNLWVDRVPAAGSWRSWLAAAGAEEIQLELWEPDATGFRWTGCRLDGIWIEIGWADIDLFEALVRDLASGIFIGHEHLQMGWTLQGAVTLRTGGKQAVWRESLEVYPEGLAERVIADQTAVWADPHVPAVRWALAARGERMGLAQRFVWDMQNLLRVLFAVNHCWDRDFKWTDEQSLDLTIKPENLSARINAMFTLDNLPRAVTINQRLIVDTLELAAAQGFEVRATLLSVTASLRQGIAVNGL